jgi:hypothetical protein
MESYIETFSGRKFYFLDPQPEDFDIKDIAHALSMNCRYTGHCDRFYSVAEHSWHMSRMAPEGQELACLLHDGSEAYITDIASPIKQHLPDYQAMEDRILSRLFAKYGLEYPLHPVVKHLDLTMLSTEAHYLLKSSGNTWDLWKQRKRPAVQHNFKPLGMDPKLARQVFLDRFYELEKQYGTNTIN